MPIAVRELVASQRRGAPAAQAGGAGAVRPGLKAVLPHALRRGRATCGQRLYIHTCMQTNYSQVPA